MDYKAYNLMVDLKRNGEWDQLNDVVKEEILSEIRFDVLYSTPFNLEYELRIKEGMGKLKQIAIQYFGEDFGK